MPSSSATVYTHDEKDVDIRLIADHDTGFPWVRLDIGRIVKADIAIFFKSESELRLFLHDLRQQVDNLFKGEQQC